MLRYTARVLALTALVVLLASAYTPAQDITSSLAAGTMAQGAVDQRARSKPARHTIFSCHRQTMSAALNRPWVDSHGVIDVAKKPRVEGAVSWSSQLHVARQDQTLQLTGNGVPNHPTGTFPVAPDSEAFRYDRNPNSIQAYTVQYTIPHAPVLAAEPGCLPMGTIGVALTGAVFFNALDAPGRDAVVNEIFDRCEGHPERHGRYHYHHYSPCFDQGDANTHSPLIGYALDGFGIYGPRDAGGAYITNDQLDACHGHTGPVPAAHGQTNVIYHYHANREFPYTLGCFSGVVALAPQRPGARAPARAVEASTPANLRVITLGTGGPRNHPERAGPSALVQYGNARFLVDMGRDTQLRLQQANVSLRDLTALLFTHHHLDHNEEFVPILLKARLRGGAGQIIGPPGTRHYADFVFSFYREDSDYRAQRTGGSAAAMRDVTVRELSGGEAFRLSGVNVKTARVNHTIHTVAYRFDADGKAIVISGDLTFSPSLIDLAHGADVLVIDAGQLGPGAPRRDQAARPGTADAVERAHGSIADVATMGQEAGVKRLVLTHFAGPNVDEAAVRPRIADIYKGEVIFARDLLEVTP